jgi:hypothetical protein
MNFVSLDQLEGTREAVCPSNGKSGKRVDSLIVKAMLNIPLDVLRNVEYRFCVDPDCPTVYYSADGLQEFMEGDLRERVYQKHPGDAEVPVCYCFQHTLGEVRAEGMRVYADIDRGVRAGKCACDIRNPQGSCCLGNVKHLVKQHGLEN